ncbi:MAG: hypothetical protein WD407_06115 [Rhodospirillales bacterium]
MPIESIGSPIIVPPTPNGAEPRTVPTNAGVFQSEIAADSVSQQVQQVQESASQPEASTEQRQTRSDTQQQSSSNEQAAGQRDSANQGPAPGEGRGENVNIEV